MTNRIALFLGLAIVSLILADLAVFGDQHLVYLGRKLADLIEYMAFWR